ncbi:mRNA interferase MazF [Halopolyspora algeriensis]|uniref:mRNA interferase MazF n=1 Tax=Halopolyspora algeriensis TaxID=1500506 RepID=A0A368VWG6_9ACTN|nr:type II toxin-antitoxin system PemK/MazF family toxin [Halopolyspora algeriensis]RCW45078.1 mRNA interferase MazF [Halopolyspora algeriensis]TQM53197.1 mRNA interferase MazF [Halopolyspora algeriensis]
MTRSGGPPPQVLRGRIVAAVIDEELGEKYYLVVSNNRRNRRLDDFLAVRLTTSRKPDLDTIVTIDDPQSSWTGAVLCDDIVAIFKSEVTREEGALSPSTMSRVDQALRSALSL